MPTVCPLPHSKSLLFISSSIPRIFNLSRRSQSSSTHPILSLFFPNSVPTFKSLLQSHSLIIAFGHSNNIFLASKLISLYSLFHKPHLSSQVFDEIPLSDTFLFNSIIQAHFSNSNYALALHFFLRLHRSPSVPNHFTVPMVLAACAESNSPCLGRIVHGISLKLSLPNTNSAVGSSLVYFYGKCGHLGDARQAFDEIPQRDVVAWTALIVCYVQNGESLMGLGCLRDMVRRGETDGNRPNCRTMEASLQACGNSAALSEGRCLHGFILKTGIWGFSSIKSSLLSMYSKCGNLDASYIAFCEFPDKDLLSWTALVGVFARNGLLGECLEFSQAMQVSGINPDGIVISCLAMGFANFTNVCEAKAFHGFMVRKCFEIDVLVNNSLLSMYCKFECLDSMEKIFNRVSYRDAGSWNCMVFGYGKMGWNAKCIDMFREMQYLGLEADSNSLAAVVTSCSQLLALNLGQSIHCYTLKTFSDKDISVLNSLIAFYGKCRNLDAAWRIFKRIKRDTVTWNTLIAACAHGGQLSDAISLFNQMLIEDVKPNSATFVSVLSACSNLAALNHGERIHNYIKEMAFECNISLSTALVDMYAKCGKLTLSREIFDAMPDKDVISWNAMISGYGVHGKASDAVEIFQKMEESGVAPNSITFLGVLSACSHVGLVDEGKHLFGRMKDYYNIVPSPKHYACMVDLLGRSGNLYEAEDMIQKMPIVPDGGVWGTLLGACKLHGNVEMGERTARQAFELDPENDGYYILMSNMYSSVERWDDAQQVRGMIKKKGVRKSAGWSAMEIAENVHVFLAGDKTHPQVEEIYATLEDLLKQMEHSGYIVKKHIEVSHVVHY